MKIRCTHNSIRLRLGKSELTHLRTHGQIRESLDFPEGSRFQYCLKINRSVHEISVFHQAGEIVIMLPAHKAQRWIEHNNQVGIEAYLSLPDQKHLHLLIEKDFPCHNHSPESQTDDTFAALAKEMLHEQSVGR
jgi:hypothetical protein